MMTQTTVLVVFLTSLILGCSSSASDGDMVSALYASYEDASKDAALENGWLPRSLPRSATDIREAHNIDSGELWAAFRYENKDLDALRHGCQPDRTPIFPDTRRTQRTAGWWPAELTSGSEKASRNKWIVYLCPESLHAHSTMTARLAVNTGSNSAWYWIVK